MDYDLDLTYPPPDECSEPTAESRFCGDSIRTGSNIRPIYPGCIVCILPFPYQ